MRAVVFAIVLTFGFSLLLAGCGEKPIGQPCNFGWPKDASGSPDCSRYPACHPLQDASLFDAVNPINKGACPIDCIQMPSLECENLICVATQIEGDNDHINGECWKPEGDPDPICPSSNVRCKGYCTKECLTDASCPKAYKCSAMAPFGGTLNCDDESLWATSCTASCTKGGQTPPGATEPCPSSGTDVNYGVCDQKALAGCCSCICYQFCPILTKKFCRKRKWDQDMFKTAEVPDSLNCGQN
jgi:hypothetical protein